MRYKTLNLASLLLALLAVPAIAAGPDTVTIQTGKPFVARTIQAQNFVDYIMLRSGQEKLPLTLVVHNGAEGAPRFSWVRISIAGNPIYASNNFAGSADTSLNISGKVGMDSNQLIVQAGGVVGAKMSWTVVSSGLALISVEPMEVAPGGQITLTGRNFGGFPTENTVNFNERQGTVTAASPTKLIATVPDSFDKDKAKVTVSRAGVTSQAIEIKIKSQPPELSDYLIQDSPIPGPTGHPDGVWSASPGMTIVIHGKNFSKNLKENIVTIGGFQADVSAGSTTSLTAVLPQGLDANNPAWGVPIAVESKGQKSKNTLQINIQMRVW